MLTVKKLKSKYPFGANSYLISSVGYSAIIDPSAPPEDNEDYGNLKYVLLTHSHFDHILEINKWVEKGCEVLIAQEELSYLSSPELNCYSSFLGTHDGYFGKAFGLSDGEVIRLGGEEIIFKRTPGHTAGSGIYLSGKFAFVGDTVFCGGGYGRWDLPGGNYSELLNSIDFILGLDEDITLFPGHGQHTSVREYKRDYRR